MSTSTRPETEIRVSVTDGDVAEAVAGGSPEQARRAMEEIVEKAMDAMDQQGRRLAQHDG